MALDLTVHIAGVFVMVARWESLEDILRCDCDLVSIADSCSNPSARCTPGCCPAHTSESSSDGTSNQPSEEIACNWQGSSNGTPYECSKCSSANTTG